MSKLYFQFRLPKLSEYLLFSLKPQLLKSKESKRIETFILKNDLDPSEYELAGIMK